MYQYEVGYYDEIDEKMVEQKGIVSASSYAEATSRITNFYGLKIYMIKIWEVDEVLEYDEIKEMF